jgi:hypothetical protein
MMKLGFGKMYQKRCQIPGESFTKGNIVPKGRKSLANYEKNGYNFD